MSGMDTSAVAVLTGHKIRPDITRMAGGKHAPRALDGLERRDKYQ